MPVTGSTRLAGVIGHPARYSLSPTLHNAAYKAMGVDVVYLALPVTADSVRTAVDAVRAFEMVGVSVTIPHKEAVIAFLDGLSDAARVLNAVNCIVNEQGTLVGHNTDGEGFTRAVLHQGGFVVEGRRCVVLGAGGAARAVTAALMRGGAADVCVVNRSSERAQQAASLAGAVGRVGVSNDIANAELVVNATPVGMGDGAGVSPIEAGLLRPNQLVVDLIYNPAKTQLLADAEAAGAKTLNGLAMLVHQGAIQIELWTGQTPPIDVMFDAVQ